MFEARGLAPPMHEPTDTPYDKLKDIPFEFILDGYTATLLDNDISLKKESDDLRHCIYRTYSNRIKDAQYLAYHITGEGCGKSGVTCGLKVNNCNTFLFNISPQGDPPEYRDPSPSSRWLHDMTRGRANSIPDSDDLTSFIIKLVNHVNKSVDTV